MDMHQSEHFKSVLNQQLDALLSTAGSALSEMVTQSNQVSESIDLAALHRDQSMMFHIRSRESRLIKKLRQALERIDNQTFGICESCGEDINPRRLEARPVTTKCIDCKQEEERLELLTN
ncbi:MAG TPA: RNA polymerase-binding protein DksA [Desulfobacteraceae bacterium]|nr:RNA polymerase-binding protein DksA [Desulfobacteraceae bacterium]|tara:strand:+ start:1889 stop:2248 length:360 start_codon:yes stop_codon:yes gene_type:complete